MASQVRAAFPELRVSIKVTVGPLIAALTDETSSAARLVIGGHRDQPSP